MAYRPTEKTEARKKAQHKLLLDTAISIVSKGGFKSLTIASLAKKADVATGTVYKYFASKADLCAEVFRMATEKEVKQVQAVAFPTGDTDLSVTCRTRLGDALRIFSERALEGRSLAYALIAEPVEAMVQQERLKYRGAYAEIFERLVNEGVDKNEFSPQNARVSADAMVGALAETLLGSIARAEQTPQEFNSEAWLQQILDFCLAGVCR